MNVIGKKILFLFLALLPVLLFLQPKLLAEQLPVKIYTIADGLARDYIYRIRQDSRGFIWFCTAEGISRFDGYGFTNYGVADGLPHRVVTDFVETHDGVYLFSTSGGLVQFNPNGKDESGSQFAVIPLGDDEGSRAVTQLLEDKDGTVWCGTAKGLYRLTRSESGWQAAFIDKELGNGTVIESVNTLALDKKGALWVGTPGSGIFRRLADGTVEHYTEENGLSQNGVNKIFIDRDEKVWVGTGMGLTLLVDDPRPNQKIAARVFKKEDGLLTNFIEILYQTSDGRLWVGTRAGLNFLVAPENNHGLSFRSYTPANGLSNLRILTIIEDKDNNMWLGAESGGAMKIPLVGFTSYFESEGLGDGRITQVFADRDHNIYVLSNKLGSLVPVVMRFDGQSFVKETPGFPPNVQLTWGWNQLATQDLEGDWWFATEHGVFRFSGNSSGGLGRAPLKKNYTVKDGIDHDEIFRLFEDARGDIWFATFGSAYRTLHRWERRTGKFYIYSPQEHGISVSAATAFANDAEGNLWIGFYTGGVSRYRDGHFDNFTEKDGVPPGFIRHLFFDSKNRLWIATSIGGVGRVDHPQGEKPKFARLTTKDGISSDQVTTVTEDKWGQIYLGTGRGIDRLDPETDRIKHFTTSDGLADNFVNGSFRDAGGALWFGTLRGLSRYVPEADKPHQPPSILISGVRVAGIKQPISAFGQAEVIIPELDYTQNQLEIDFLSINLAAGEQVRYQYKFENSDNDWSALSEQHTVTLPNLPSGDERFLVRAVNSDGLSSTQPAVVAFRILPPVWRRWWFITLAGLLVVAAIIAIERYRAARLSELKTAFGELSISELRFRRLIEQSPFGIMILAPDGSINSINETYLRMWGGKLTAEDVRNWDMRTDEQLVENGVTEGLGRAFAGEFVAFPTMVYDPQKSPLREAMGEDAEPKWLNAVAYPVKSPTGELREVICVLEDITERKKAEINLQKSREERLAELEKVRSRIATDLHDDIGASLTQIAILSEVAQAQEEKSAGKKPVKGAFSEPLTIITKVSNELVGTMSDIVWSINPTKDHLSDLIQRMRRFASDSLSAKSIAFHFDAPPVTEDIPIGTNIRREFFLVFKESINNIVKHSRAARVDVVFQVIGQYLILKVKDDGKGFDKNNFSGEGNGVLSMTKRAAEMDGEFEIVSEIGKGTEIILKLPLNMKNVV